MSPIAILFANLKGNLGDFAILHAMLTHLSESYPDRPIHVYSHPFYDVNANKLEAFRAGAPDFYVQGKTPEPRISPMHSLLLKTGRLLRQPERMIESFRNDNRHIFSQFADYKAIYFAGGDQWSGKRLGICMFGTLLAISEYNPNIFGYPFSVKASILKTYSSGFIAKTFAHLHPPIVTRDSSSAEILSILGVQTLTSVDCVFRLWPLSPPIAPMPERNCKRILLVLKGERGVLHAGAKRLLDAGLTVELLTSCEPEDGRVYRQLVRELAIPMIAPQTWQEVVAEMKACRLIVTNRLHGLILGTYADVPILPVVSRAKARAFAKDSNVVQVVNRPEDLSLGHIENALRHGEETLAQLRAYRDSSRLISRQAMPVALGLE